jgi:hypothetical protein
LDHGGQHVSDAPEGAPSSFLARRITLLPIEFEACLHVLDTGGTTTSQIAQFHTLSKIIALVVAHNAPAQTYTLFTNMVLCAASASYNSPEPLISVDTAAKLLHQLINVARGTNGYGVVQTSRWIRCIVQLIVDAPEREAGSPNMKLVEEVVEQAIVLASAGDSQEQGREEHGIDTEQADAELGAAYPAEELEWLATTLFNLAVDYYAGEEEEQGAEWARKAVKLADILATSWDVGDGGLLLSVLGRKMAELGWGVGDDYTS